MNKKIRAYLSVVFMSVTFFMMLDTQYVRALGDYFLEYLGLKSWTMDQAGIHLTIFYFTPLFMIGLILSKRYAIDGFKMNWKRVVLLFIGLNTFFSFGIGEIAKGIKMNADDLSAITLEAESYLVYECEEDDYETFEANIRLKNYSENKKEFHLRLNEKKLGHLKFYDIDGREKSFLLEGKELKTININLEDTVIQNSEQDNYFEGIGLTGINQVILSDDTGDKVNLEQRKFFEMNFKK